MVRPLHGERVAIRIERRRDRTHRLMFEDLRQRVLREEWRCVQCGGWFEQDGVTWVESGRTISGALEVFPTCLTCSSTPRATME
jgi:rubrerythrin